MEPNRMIPERAVDRGPSERTCLLEHEIVGLGECSPILHDLEEPEAEEPNAVYEDSNGNNCGVQKE
jgi:hypothetical protein